ncbi:MAG: nucleotide sugar dehydrogenase [Candidatus Omnitrophota bacterium]|jgi:UDP-N-acetyl-D-glucosamine dehydrogenase
MSAYKELKSRINGKKAIITVIGLGYVGLPIAVEFSKKGFTVNGLDTNKRRIKSLEKGISYINDIPSSEVRKALAKKKFHVTADRKILKGSDVVIICVPTPLRKTKDPDISYIVHASRALRKEMKPGQLIVVESTTFPGTTRDVILPILEKSGYRSDKDFYLAFSPERIDPGNKKYDLTNIPKVIGGITEKGTDLGKLLYSKIVKRVIGVSNAETAEVTKLLENTFRIVNIALVNEFASLCHKLDIDVWEVIKAARTKPFGFMPFYPGPGIGGHCIPADPMYLSWKAKTVGFRTNMVDLAARVNRSAPKYIVERMIELLKTGKKKLKESRVLVVGVSYKKDVKDLRESPALDIIKELKKKRVNVAYHDPYIPYLDLHGIRMTSRGLTSGLLKQQDIVLIAADHSDLDYKMIAEKSVLVFDARNAFGQKGLKGENIVKL